MAVDKQAKRQLRQRLQHSSIASSKACHSELAAKDFGAAEESLAFRRARATEEQSVTDTSATTTASQFSPRKWQTFDVVLLVFSVLGFLFALVASFFATYRVGRTPWASDVVAAWTLAAVWFWLFVAGVVRLIVQTRRKQASAASVITLMCFGVYMCLIGIPFGIGRVMGRFLLAKTGINQRVAQECLMIMHSDLCVANVHIKAQSGTWEVSGESNHFSRLVHEMQVKCPAICSLKPRYISWSPEQGVDIDLASALEYYGYRFSVDGTNGVLRWITEVDFHGARDSGRALVRLPYEKPALILTNLEPWQSKLSN
jgi:hypothetical protein